MRRGLVTQECRRPRRNGVQDMQLPHLGASAHPATTTTRRGADAGLFHCQRKAGLL